MLFKHNELGEQITEIHLKQIEDANRQARIEYYQRRWDMYKGIATDPNEPDFDILKCKEFFPAGKNETDDEYRERMKVWNPQGAVIINRLADMVFKGGVEYKFVPVNPEDESAKTMAEAATSNFQADLEYNKWSIVGRERVVEPMAIGQISDWLDYRKFDPSTGEQFDNGGRIRFIKRWPWFAEPVVHPENVTEIIGAAYIYTQENEAISPAISLQMSLSGERRRITELWLDPAYNSETGELISAGAYVRFEDETVEMPAGKEDWQGDNKYKLTPVHFWQNVDMDESQFNAESFFDRFDDLWLKLSRVDSNKVSGVQYIINQRSIIASPEATPKDIPTRHNVLIKIPQGEPQSSIANMPRNLDNAPEDNLAKDLRFGIGEAGCYSASLMDMEGIGQAAQSGIARKIMYAPTVDCVDILRKNYAEGMKQVMRKCMAVKIYENGGSLDGIDLKKIKPEVQFLGSVIPVDEVEELTQDILKLKSQLIDRKGLVMKYNPEIKTDAQADEFLKLIEAEQPKPTASAPFELRRPRGTGNAPNENQNA